MIHMYFLSLWQNMASPSVWNYLPDYLCGPSVSRDTFRQRLKTFVFVSTSDVLRQCTLYKFTSSLSLFQSCVSLTKPMERSAIIEVGTGAPHVGVREVRWCLRCVVRSVERVVYTI